MLSMFGDTTMIFMFAGFLASASDRSGLMAPNGNGPRRLHQGRYITLTR
jgi:hypothetical protein